jgi:hypothetical protein
VLGTRDLGYLSVNLYFLSSQNAFSSVQRSAFDNIQSDKYSYSSEMVQIKYTVV